MTEKKLSDVDFVIQHDVNLGKEYADAKQFINVAPIQSLVQLRSILSATYKLIAKSAGIALVEKNTQHHEVITQLEQSKLVSSEIIRRLKEIKHAGNQAAHKESFKLTSVEYVELAHQSFREFCELLKLIRASHHGIFEPDFEFTNETTSQLKDLAFNALFENDVKATFRLGIALCEYHAEKNEQLVKAAEEGEYVPFNRESFRLSINFIESAAQSRHMEAMYEFAHICMEGIGREKNTNLAMDYFAMAADQGHILAKAYIGRYILFDEAVPDQRDINYALTQLKEAAQHEDPVALDTLSQIYSEGRFQETDPELALNYLLKSAEAGFPEAQIKAGAHCIDNDEFDEATSWFDKAAAGGIQEALLYKARLLKHIMKHSAVELDEVVKAFKDYISLSGGFTGIYEFASIILERKPTDIPLLVEGLQCFVSAYLHSDCPKDKLPIIRSKAKQLIKYIDSKTRKDLVAYQATWLTSDMTDLLMFFDKNGELKSKKDLFESPLHIINMTEKDIKRHCFIPKQPVEKPSKKVKYRPNDKCHCNSGKKYKDCHRLKDGAPQHMLLHT